MCEMCEKQPLLALLGIVFEGELPPEAQALLDEYKEDAAEVLHFLQGEQFTPEQVKKTTDLLERLVMEGVANRLADSFSEEQLRKVFPAEVLRRAIAGRVDGSIGTLTAWLLVEQHPLAYVIRIHE